MNSETLQISSGGRVKAAGVSFSMFTEPAKAYMDNPNVLNAATMTDAYMALRKSPPEAVRNRFFPRSSAVIGAIKNGVALPRTNLKNDQGAGTFLTHQTSNNSHIDNSSPLRVDIDRETGFTILEAHLTKQLALQPDPTIMKSEIDEVKKQFSLGDLAAAQNAYEKLIEAGNKRNIRVRREAAVGREGLFFIHPSIPKLPVEIDRFTHEKMRLRGEQLVDQMREAAHQRRDQFAYENGLTTAEKRSFPPLYFQIDYLLTNNRSIQVADVGLPDVGFFLVGINHEGNPTVQDAQSTVSERLYYTASTIQKKFIDHKSKTVCFVTRHGVLKNDEDTLEITEIAVLKNAVEALGCKTKVISEEEVMQMTSDELGILMNIDTASQAFQILLRKRTQDESVPMYPDPFLLLAQNELTDFPQVTIKRETLDLLSGVFTSTERASCLEKPAVQLAAIEQIIRRSGMPDGCEILYMYIPGQSTPIAFYKYDPRGLEIALKYASNAPSVRLRGITVNANNAVLFDPDGNPMYTTFRYMFNQKI